MRARFAMVMVAVSAAQALAAPPANSVKPATAAAPAANVPLSITIYDKENYQGRSVSVRAATPNLAALQFEDKVASFEVAGAGDWVLCADRNYKGVCVRVTAKAGDLRVIQLFGRVSSLYPVPAPAAPAATPH